MLKNSADYQDEMNSETFYEQIEYLIMSKRKLCNHHGQHLLPLSEN